jgi:hypothetical protein
LTAGFNVVQRGTVLLLRGTVLLLRCLMAKVK